MSTQRGSGKITLLAVAALAALGIWSCGEAATPGPGPGPEAGIDGSTADHGATPDSPGPLDTGLPDQAPAGLDAPVPHQHQNIDVNQAWSLIKGGAHTLLDVREPSELIADGFIAGAVNLPYTSGVLSSDYGKLPSTKGVIVYCRSGNRSGLAAPFLAGKGFSPVFNVKGGFNAWKAAGLPYATKSRYLTTVKVSSGLAVVLYL